MSGGNKEFVASIIETCRQLEIPFDLSADKFTDPDKLLSLLTEILKTCKRFHDEKQAISSILNETSVELREHIGDLSLVRRMGENLDINTEINDLYSNVLNIILDELSAENASIMIWQEKTQELELVMGKNRRKKIVTHPNLRLKKGEGVAGLAASSGEPIFINDAAKDKRFCVFPDAREEVGSLLSLPFPIPGELIGVINVSHPQAGVFGPNHLRVLVILANQIAVAINNARLFNKSVIANQKLTASEEALRQKIEELVQMNQSLQRIRFLNESIIENVQNGIFLIDDEGQILTWNKWLELLCHVNRQQAVGKNVDEVFKEYCGIEIGELINKSLGRDRRATKKRLTMALGGKKEYWEFSFIPLAKQSGEKSQVIVVINDITAQVLAEEERLNFIHCLQGNNKQLEDLNRVKSEFVSMVSHELRTPLTVLKGYLNLFSEQRYGEINQKQREKLQVMTQKAADLTRLIEELLDLSVMETGAIHLDRTKINLRVLLQNMVTDFVALGKKVEFSSESDQEIPAFLGDAEKIKQVVNNLIENALKFSPADKAINVKLSFRDNYILLSVEDEGIGIKDADKEKIFHKFYQGSKTKGPMRGVGLGLAIAKEIIEKHGGAIWVDDNQTQGAIFSIKLPVSPQQREISVKETAAQLPVKPQEYTGKRILIIEDDLETIELLRDIFEPQRFEITLAVDGVEAVDKGLLKKYDLIMLDIILPRLNGYQICRLLKEEKINKHTPLIIISALNQQEVMRAIGSKYQVAAYISKPFQNQEILRQINQVIAGSG